MSYLKVITPTNIAEEKEKFFSSKTYSPHLSTGGMMSQSKSISSKCLTWCRS